ncbi:MAG: DUF4983 domain-containing protein [Prevotella sp.]|jgi:hypothetical protein|nr:DUF4983 domain-containing protein [Prevotella sp.]
MKTIKRITRNVLRMGMAGLILVFASACNETIDDTLRYDYPESGSNYTGGHVLLIVMDGVSGRAVQNARNARKAPILKAMASNAVYTDYGLADNTNKIGEEMMTNERGWANLMLGNTVHDVKQSADLESLAGEANMLTRLAGEGCKVNMYAASEDFRRVFTDSDIEAPVITTDEDVKTNIVSALDNSLNPASDMLVAEFKGVKDAGDANGFYNTDGTATDEVIDAISVVDGYIGEIMTALESRPNYKNENWLVVVTSNYGGEAYAGASASSHYEDVTRNTFTLMYNERLIPKVQARPSENSLTYSFSTPMWSIDKDNANLTTFAESAKMNGNTSIGNIAVGESMTIMFFIKINETYVSSKHNYVVLSKASKIRQNGGWSISFYNTPNKGLLVELGNQSSDRNGTSAGFAEKGVWHSFALTFEPDATNANMKTNVYVDGKLDTYRPNRTIKASSFTSLMNGMQNIPLRIGGANDRASQLSGADTKSPVADNSFCITNVQIYNKALNAAEIEKYAGKNQLHLLGENYPLWDNLVGYWPCDLEEDGGNPVMKDYSKYRATDGSTDFIIDRGATNVWTEGNANDPGLHPLPETDKFYYLKTINTVDISRQIFLWMGKSIHWEWNMEGQAWTWSYNDVAG